MAITFMIWLTRGRKTFSNISTPNYFKDPMVNGILSNPGWGGGGGGGGGRDKNPPKYLIFEDITMVNSQGTKVSS